MKTKKDIQEFLEKHTKECLTAFYAHGKRKEDATEQSDEVREEWMRAFAMGEVVGYDKLAEFLGLPTYEENSKEWNDEAVKCVPHALEIWEQQKFVRGSFGIAKEKCICGSLWVRRSPKATEWHCEECKKMRPVESGM